MTDKEFITKLKFVPDTRKNLKIIKKLIIKLNDCRTPVEFFDKNGRQIPHGTVVL
jgi:hypothetical protein